MKNYLEERIKQADQKIRSEIMQLIFYGVVISLLIKVLFLHYGLEQCILEFLILILTPIYYIIRCQQLDLVLSTFTKPTWKKNILPSIIIGISVFAFVTQRQDKIGMVMFGIVFSIASITIHFGCYHLEKHRKQKLEEKYDQQ